MQTINVNISNLIGHIVVIDSNNPEASDTLTKLINKALLDAIASAKIEPIEQPEKWIKERDTQAFPTEELEPMLPGTYRCILPFTNEMGYKWKQGEEVQVVRYREQHGTCLCRLHNQPQEFEMNANIIRNHFSLTKVIA
jgi:hypothetical protein